MQGKFDEAIEHLTDAIRFKPDFTEALHNLSILQSYQEKGNTEK